MWVLYSTSSSFLNYMWEQHHIYCLEVSFQPISKIPSLGNNSLF